MKKIITMVLILLITVVGVACKEKEQEIQEIVVKVSDFEIKETHIVSTDREYYNIESHKHSVGVVNDTNNLLQYSTVYYGKLLDNDFFIKSINAVPDETWGWGIDNTEYQPGDKIHFIVDNYSYDLYNTEYNNANFKDRNLDDPYDFGYITVKTNDGETITAHVKLDPNNEYIVKGDES